MHHELFFFFITNSINIDAFIIGIKFAHHQKAKIILEFIKINYKVKKNNILKETFLYSHTPFSLDDMTRGVKKNKSNENTTISAPHKIKRKFLYIINFI